MSTLSLMICMYVVGIMTAAPTRSNAAACLPIVLGVTCYEFYRQMKRAKAS